MNSKIQKRRPKGRPRQYEFKCKCKTTDLKTVKCPYCQDKLRKICLTCKKEVQGNCNTPCPRCTRNGRRYLFVYELLYGVMRVDIKQQIIQWLGGSTSHIPLLMYQSSLYTERSE